MEFMDLPTGDVLMVFGMMLAVFAAIYGPLFATIVVVVRHRRRFIEAGVDQSFQRATETGKT